MATARVVAGYRLDSLVRYSGAANTRAVRSQKKYMATFEVTQPTASRHMNGCKYSPTTRFLVQLASADTANAWPVIAEGIAVVNQKQICDELSEVLWARLRELDELEHSAEARENGDVLRAAVNPTPELLEAAATADIAEAEISLERAAIRRELAERIERKRRQF